MAQDPSTPEFVVDAQQHIDITFGKMEDASAPILGEADFIIPEAQAEETQAQVADQGYSYNQANLTYNQAGVYYGGLYDTNQDTIPTFDGDAKLLAPEISDIISAGSTIKPPIPNNQTTVGPGWFMYIAQV